MNIFLSWSGQLSHAIALALRDWLPRLFPSARPFVSSEDIHKGRRWFEELHRTLAGGGDAIFCLTPENLDAPWMNFEAGAFAKSLEEASLFTLLVNLSASEVCGPFAQFQHTTAAKTDVLRLVQSINAKLPAGAWAPEHLRANFDRLWQELDTRIQEAIVSNPRVIHVNTLGRDGFHITGKRYVDIVFVGPGIIHIERSSVVGCRFSKPPGMPMETSFWPMISPHGAYLGLVVFSNCAFLRCTFDQVGIAAYPAQIEKFVADIKVESDNAGEAKGVAET